MYQKQCSVLTFRDVELDSEFICIKCCMSIISDIELKAGAIYEVASYTLEKVRIAHG